MDCVWFKTENLLTDNNMVCANQVQKNASSAEGRSAGLVACHMSWNYRVPMFSYVFHVYSCSYGLHMLHANRKSFWGSNGDIPGGQRDGANGAVGSWDHGTDLGIIK